MTTGQFFVLVVIAALGGALGPWVRHLLIGLWDWLRNKASILARVAAGLSAIGAGVFLAVMATAAFEQMVEATDRIASHDTRLDRLTEQVQGAVDIAEALDVLLTRQWHNVISQRDEDQCYRNDTGYPIEVAVSTGASTETERRNYNFCQLELIVDGSTIVLGVNNNDNGGNKYCTATATIPPGAGYEIDADGFREGGILSWWELRTGDTPPPVC